jgi:hypothetical protein
MTQPAQTVIYRLDEGVDPAWQFYSTPESIVGGGNTLDEARIEFRESLKFSLDTNTVPEVREYVEKEVGQTGIWLRLPVSQPGFDGILDAVRDQIAAYPEDHAWFFDNPTAGGDPVIVTASPDAPLRSILTQMSTHDRLILAMHRRTPEKVQNVFLALAGPEAADDTGTAATSFSALGLTPDSPLRELLEAALDRRLTTVSAPALC